MYQAKSGKLNIGDQSKVGLFFSFLFSLLFFIYLFSLFVFRFSLYRFRYSFFTFGVSPFVSTFRFSLFVFHFFDIQNRAQYRILTFKLRPNILFLHSKSYFDVQTGAEYRIYIQNPILKFKIGPKIVF